MCVRGCLPVRSCLRACVCARARTRENACTAVRGRRTTQRVACNVHMPRVCQVEEGNWTVYLLTGPPPPSTCTHARTTPPPTVSSTACSQLPSGPTEAHRGHVRLRRPARSTPAPFVRAGGIHRRPCIATFSTDGVSQPRRLHARLRCLARPQAATRARGCRSIPDIRCAAVTPQRCLRACLRMRVSASACACACAFVSE